MINLDAFGGSSGSRSGGRRRNIRIEGEEEEDSESEETESHYEEKCDEPVTLPNRKLRFGMDRGFSVYNSGRPGL